MSPQNGLYTYITTSWLPEHWPCYARPVLKNCEVNTLEEFQDKIKAKKAKTKAIKKTKKAKPKNWPKVPK